MVQLALPVSPCFNGSQLGEKLVPAAGLELVDKGLAVRRHLAGGLLQLGPVDLHGDSGVVRATENRTSRALLTQDDPF